jgi:hypothetical protein
VNEQAKIYPRTMVRLKKKYTFPSEHGISTMWNYHRLVYQTCPGIFRFHELGFCAAGCSTCNRYPSTIRSVIVIPMQFRVDRRLFLLMLLEWNLSYSHPRWVFPALRFSCCSRIIGSAKFSFERIIVSNSYHPFLLVNPVSVLLPNSFLWSPYFWNTSRYLK